MTRAAVAALTVCLAGCASYTGDRFSEFETPAQGRAIVYVYSAETGCIDLGQMNADILVNNEQRFTLAEGSFTALSLPPGTYAFDASTDDQKACQGQWDPGKYWPTVSLELAAGDMHFLQYNPPAESCLSTCERHLVEVSAATARTGMTGTRQLAQ